jgi:catalase-peroxidase
MMVSDIALREDPAFSAIALPWMNDFQSFTDAFVAAWCKSSNT